MNLQEYVYTPPHPHIQTKNDKKVKIVDLSFVGKWRRKPDRDQD